MVHPEAFLDESGTQTKDGLLVVATSLSTDDRWTDLSKAWKPIIDELGRPFHSTTDDRLHGRLAALMAQHTALAHVFLITPASYKTLVPDTVKGTTGGPYRLAVMTSLLFVGRWAREKGLARVKWNIEKGHKEYENVARMLDAVMHTEENQEMFWCAGWEGIDKTALPGHCADLLAHQTNRCITTNKPTAAIRAIVDAGIYVEGEMTDEIIKLMLVPRLLEMVTTLKQERRAEKAQKNAGRRVKRDDV